MKNIFFAFLVGGILIMSATDAKATLICVATKTQYNGSLGGVAGADTICEGEYGTNFQFARDYYLAVSSFNNTTISTSIEPWIDGPSNCSDWTSDLSGMFDVGQTVEATLGSTGIVTFSPAGNRCNVTNPLLCCNTNLP